MHWPQKAKTPCFTRVFSHTRAAFPTSGNGWGTVRAAHLAGQGPLAGDKRGYKYPLGGIWKERARTRTRKGTIAWDLTRLWAEGPAIFSNCIHNIIYDLLYDIAYNMIFNMI